MELPTVLVPEIRFNKNHLSLTFRIPYWLVATFVLIFAVLRWRDKDFEVLVVTTVATWVFWLLNRYWPFKLAEGGVWIRYWNHQQPFVKFRERH